jgi:hypothetical protein
MEVRIWDREGAGLHAVGEQAAGLLCALAWQPNCRHLYAAIGAAGTAEAAAAMASEGGAAPDGGATADAEAQEQRCVGHVGAWKRELRRRRQERDANAGEQVRPSGRRLPLARNGRTPPLF